MMIYKLKYLRTLQRSLWLIDLYQILSQITQGLCVYLAKMVVLVHTAVTTSWFESCNVNNDERNVNVKIILRTLDIDVVLGCVHTVCITTI